MKDNQEDSIKTKFTLTDGLYTEAECIQKDVVYLWLGANTIVEYNYEEALELLNNNLANAKKNQSTYDVDLEYIKDQITIMEVNFARVHNYKVAVNKTDK
jgi:prefoldin subunit 5